MIKYIDREEESASHFLYCEKNHIPYVEIRPVGGELCEIFFDVTELPESQEIANHIYNIYQSYVLFFQINQSQAAPYLDAGPDYIHTIAVKKEHAKNIAEGMFDFILLYMK